MSWRGGIWNRQEMEEDGQRELANMGQVPTIPLFTPANYDHAPAPFAFIGPLNTRHDRALDRDTFYDLKPDDTASTNLIGMRHTSATGFGRHTLLDTPFSTDHNVRAMSYQSQGPRAGEPPRKRLKSTNSNCSQSAKAPANNENKNFDQEIISLVTDEAPEDLPGNPGLQLPSPPNIERRQPKISAPLKSAKKGSKMGPFKNPVITKPKIAPKPEIQQRDDAPMLRPVINHLGWTTTQEAVKLSKTTLDRLAAFRYTSVFSKAPVNSLTNNIHLHEKPGQFPVSQREQDKARFLDSSSNHDFPGDALNERRALPAEFRNPIDDSYPAQMQPQEHAFQFAVPNEDDSHEEDPNLFKEIAWHGSDLHENFPNSSQIDHHRPQNNSTDNLVPFGGHNLETQPVSNDTDAVSGHKYEQTLRNKMVQASHQRKIDVSETMHRSSSYGNPTSSRTKEMETIIETAGRAEALMSPEFHQSSEYGNPPSSEARVMARISPVLENDQETIEIPNPCSSVILVNGLQNPDSGCEDPIQNHIQVLHSHLHREAETIIEPHMTAVEEFDLDDFNDGIDDEDLLGLGSTSMAQGNNHINWIGHIGYQADDLAEDLQPDLSERSTITCPRPIAQEHGDTPSSHKTNLEPDDEYPLDEGDEEDMLNFQEYETGIVENCEVPTSLNYGEHEDPTSGEVFDRSLQYSSPRSRASMSQEKAVRLPTNQNSDNPAALPEKTLSSTNVFDDNEEEDWSFIRSNDSRSAAPKSAIRSQTRTPAASPFKGQQSRTSATQEIDQNLTKKKSSQPQVIDFVQSLKHTYILDDSQEYEPLLPFARPDFPSLMRDRSPIVGLSTQTFLRVCFRVGELFKEGGRCDALNQNAMIELYARVTFSSREPGTTKQHFQFADLWHDRPPYPTGALSNYKSSGLAETESRVFVGAPEGIMARCLGTLKRQSKGANGGWLLHIVSIRETDWEEIRWTRRIVGAGLVKTERPNL